MNMHIHSAWKHYFTHRHEGLGTTYERFLVHRIFERISANYTIRNVLEAPLFGMTGVSGINSLWWAKQGARVTLLDNNQERVTLIWDLWQEFSLEADIRYHPFETALTLPFEADAFELAWNFAAVWFVPDLAAYLAELTRISRNVVLLCIPNRLNIFHIMRMRSPEMAQSVHVDNINPGKITHIMQKLNWPCVERGYFDIPPWPDIAMNKEDILQKIGLKHVAERLKQKTNNAPLCILDYFAGKNPGMEADILKYAFLEKSPRLFARFWAHHQFLMFARST
jgi:hypothetical protein